MKMLKLPTIKAVNDYDLIDIESIQYISGVHKSWDYDESKEIVDCNAVYIRTSTGNDYTCNFLEKNHAEIWRSNLLDYMFPNKKDIVDISSKMFLPYDRFDTDFVTVNTDLDGNTAVVRLSSIDVVESICENRDSSQFIISTNSNVCIYCAYSTSEEAVEVRNNIVSRLYSHRNL